MARLKLSRDEERALLWLYRGGPSDGIRVSAFAALAEWMLLTVERTEPRADGKAETTGAGIALHLTLRGEEMAAELYATEQAAQPPTDVAPQTKVGGK